MQAICVALKSEKSISMYELKNILSQWRWPSDSYCSDGKLCLPVSEVL